jgi:methylmalonyl-CoA epimerase
MFQYVPKNKTMIKRINHIGIAVKSLGLSSEIFTKLFGEPAAHTETVPEQKATIAFYPVGESSFELIESTSAESSIAKFIDKRGEGIHHICLEVDDIKSGDGASQRTQFSIHSGFIPPAGGDGYWVAFIHPRSANGVLIELCEKMK